MKISLRKADDNDCRDLWLWRNHPEVRKWCSANKEEIQYEEHSKWFKEKMGDEGILILIAQDENNNKLGQVRFDNLKGKQVGINVNLNPDYFNRKIGSGIISLASDKIMEKYTSIDSICAEVKDDNIASARAFEKAGYKLESEKVKNQDKLKIYFLRR